MINPILEKLEKMIRLASSNPNENEAEMAMKMAQKLAIQNDIDLSSIVLENNSKPTFEIAQGTVDGGRRIKITQKFVTAILINFFNVRIVEEGNRDSGKKIHFIGTKDDVAYALFLNEYLNNKFQELWDNYYSENNVDLKVKKVYYEGIYNGLYQKLKLQKKELENQVNQAYGLVVVTKKEAIDNFTNELFKNLRKKVSSKTEIRKNDVNHYYNGLNDGRNINLNKQIQ